MSNPGHATINGGTVYYLYDAPTSNTDLKHELEVLQTFLERWNNNEGDIHHPSQMPNDTKAAPPATRLIVTKLNHQSTHATYRNQPKHISVYVCTEANWALTPHEYGAVVHVFPLNEDPAQGYENYFMHSKARQKLNSTVIQAALAAAIANNFGTLGQGNLA